MEKAYKCKWCGHKVEKRFWRQGVDRCSCPVGTYAYYACTMCGYRYTPKEAKDELEAISSKGS